MFARPLTLAPIAVLLLACADSDPPLATSESAGQVPAAPIVGTDDHAFAPPVPALDSTGGEAATSSGPGRESAPGSPVPEPGTLLLFGTGLASLAWAARRRQRVAADSR